jgi:hypothetical protein
MGQDKILRLTLYFIRNRAGRKPRRPLLAILTSHLRFRRSRECEILGVVAIQIVRKDPETFEVEVKAAGTTTHTVTLKADYYQKLTHGAVPPERLIEKSFEFLLERESNTSILSRFELSVIGRYFPEYEKTIVQRL